MRRVQRCFSLNLLALTLLGSWMPVQGQERFRPESEREQMREKSAYEKWIEQEGIPIYRGQAIPSVVQLPLGPWKRMGIQGAYVVLDGTQGMIDAIVSEISTGKKTQPERHFFEENLLVLSGLGKTEIWLEENAERQTVYWRKGTVFSPPLNTWHQHFNTGKKSARFIKLGSPTGPGGSNVVFKMLANRGMQGSSYMINFKDEDPEIRERFEAELKRNGSPLQMPPLEELVALEKEAEKVSGGMLQP